MTASTFDYSTKRFDVAALEKDGAVAIAKASGFKFDEARATKIELQYLAAFIPHAELWKLAADSGATPDDLADCVLDDGEPEFDIDAAERQIMALRDKREAKRIAKGEPRKAVALDDYIDRAMASRDKSSASAQDDDTAHDETHDFDDTFTIAATIPAVAVPLSTTIKDVPTMQVATVAPAAPKVAAAAGDIGGAIAEIINKALGQSVGVTPESVKELVVAEVGHNVSMLSAAIAADTAKLKGAMNDFDLFKQSLTAGLTATMEKTIAEIEAKAVRRVEVKNPKTGEYKDLGKQHYKFDDLLAACSARGPDGHRLNIWLTGPAGSGKTTAAGKVAEALGLDFAFNGAIDTEYKLMGFRDATGTYRSTAFRKIYEFGGVYLFDEIDGSLPSALLALNAAMANGCCDFPDGMVQRHPDCVVIAGANTSGLGATSSLTARIKQDAAFLDRFVELKWPIDEDLEKATCPDTKWCEYVQRMRRLARDRGLNVTISPRASYHGASLLATGLPLQVVKLMTVLKGMTEEQINQLTRD